MKKRKPMEFSGSEEIEQRRSLALEFYEAILAPDDWLKSTILNGCFRFVATTLYKQP
jgi:hypothetical protein